MTRTLTHEAARAFYDRFGARQDRQGFYEDPAIERLLEHAAFVEASRVVELGCGTGRLARRLLSRELPHHASYLGLDVSQTMVALATARLEKFGARAEVRRTDGEVTLPVADAACDRVVATYVLDLLSDEDVAAFLSDAHRALSPAGLLCLVSLTRGRGLGHVVSRLWAVVHALRPSLVGGCRPVRIATRLEDDAWSIRHASVVQPWGIPSEVLVARRAQR